MAVFTPHSISKPDVAEINSPRMEKGRLFEIQGKTSI